MEAMIRVAAILAGLAFVGGCSSTWETKKPVSGSTTQASHDTVQRKAGRLRKLVLLPPVFETNPQSCAARIKLPVKEYASVINNTAKKYLVDWKNYEIIDPYKALAGATGRKLTRELGIWQEDSPVDRLPPDELRGPIQAVAQDLGADGVIIIHAAPECVDWLDIVLHFPLYGKAFGRNFSAGIYDAENGSLIWQHYVHLATDSKCIRSEDCIKLYTESLLRTLESAVPRALVN